MYIYIYIYKYIIEIIGIIQINDSSSEFVATVNLLSSFNVYMQ